MKSPKKSKRPAGMPRFHRPTPEMQRWSAMLSEELSDWPNVTTKPMFGFTSFYRGENIFAAIPKTRCLHTAQSVMFRLPEESRWQADVRKDPRVPGEFLMKKWIGFEIHEEKDLRDVLQWFERAYEEAGKRGR